MHQQLKKMSLIGLILMIFTSVFGFANSPSAFYLMGYSAMPFYLFSALFFFIPFALMMAEMGSAYSNNSCNVKYVYASFGTGSNRSQHHQADSPSFKMTVRQCCFFLLYRYDFRYMNFPQYIIKIVAFIITHLRCV